SAGSTKNTRTGSASSLSAIEGTAVVATPAIKITSRTITARNSTRICIQPALERGGAGSRGLSDMVFSLSKWCSESMKYYTLYRGETRYGSLAGTSRGGYHGRAAD